MSAPSLAAKSSKHSTNGGRCKHVILCNFAPKQKELFSSWILARMSPCSRYRIVGDRPHLQIHCSFCRCSVSTLISYRCCLRCPQLFKNDLCSAVISWKKETKWWRHQGNAEDSISLCCLLEICCTLRLLRAEHLGRSMHCPKHLLFSSFCPWIKHEMPFLSVIHSSA